MNTGSNRIVVLDLDEKGCLVHPELRTPVPDHALPGVLDRILRIPRLTTDIVVFVHGWRTPPERALAAVRRLQSQSEGLLARNRRCYPEIPEHYQGFYITLRWQSRTGYRRGRARAHDATREGHAAHVVSTLLGYLNDHRDKPGPEVLQTGGGQYLHCVGHSFGGRFLCQAIQEAGPGQSRPLLYGPVRRDPRYPYTVDNLLVFQMAARPDCFAGNGIFAPLLGEAPIGGPVTLTHSRHDRATGLWHLLAERRRGIGTVGVRTALVGTTVSHVALRAVGDPYTEADLRRDLVDVDASKVFRGGRWAAQGAHSDIWRSESWHLLLSLVDHAREVGQASE